MRFFLLSCALTIIAQPILAARTPLQNYLAGNFSLVLRDYGRASSYFGAALTATPTDVLMRRRAFELALTSGRFNHALLLGQKIYQQDQTISSVNQLLVIESMRRKDWVSANKTLINMPDVGIDAVVVPLLKSWTAVGKGDLVAARKALDNLERGSGMSALKQHQLAWIATIGGDIVTARAGLAELTKTPKAAGTNNMIAAAALMSAAGDREGAIKLLSYDEPEHLPTAIVTAINSLQAGKLLEVPLKLPQQGIKGASVNLAQYAVWLSPEQAELKLALVDILTDSERELEASQLLDVIPTASNTVVNVAVARARVMAQKQNFDEAAKLLEQAIELQPKRVALYMALGDVQRGREHFEAAVVAYDKAIALQKLPLTDASSSLFFARGITFERLKAWDKTETDLKQALALRPNDPTLLNYIGYSWLDQKRNIAEATKMIERALELRPADGAIIDSLGWAYFIDGKIDKAIELLEQALAAVPSDPTVNEHLGDAYWAAGRTIEARHRWAAALELEPEKEQQARITHKIDFGLISLLPQHS
jgi:tetratricopeptide (TPR) repeat protein